MNWIKKLILTIIFGCMIHSMNGKKEIILVENINRRPSEEYIDSCTSNFLKTGNHKDYFTYVEHSNKTNLAYDLLMADKYNNPDACYFVYLYLTELGEKYEYKIDSKVWDLAFYYLHKGAELNDFDCLIRLSIIYKEGNEFVLPDTMKSNYYRAKYDSIKQSERNHFR